MSEAKPPIAKETTIAKLTTVPMISTKSTTVPTTLAKPTAVPMLSTKTSTLPVILAKPTTVLVSAKPTTVSVISTKPTTVSMISTKPTTVSVISTKPTAVSIISTKSTTVPMISTKSTTVPMTLAKPTDVLMISTKTLTPPIILAKPTTVPMISAKPTTVSVISTKPTTVSMISTKPTTVSMISAKPTTVPIISTKPTTVSMISAKPIIESMIATKPTTVSVLSTKPTTVSMISAMPTTVSMKSVKPTTVSMKSAKPTTVPMRSAKPTTVPVMSVKRTTVLMSSAKKQKKKPIGMPTASAKVANDCRRIALPFKLDCINGNGKTFVESLFAISDDFSNQPFYNAIIIGKKSILASQILAIKIKGEAIYADLSTISKENLTKLLEKVRQLKKKFTVCCLLFDLASVSTTVNLSACSFYGCEEPLQSVLKEMSNSDQIERIKDVVKELSLILPVIVFPLFPAAVYTVNASMKLNHDFLHKLRNTNENLFLIDEKFVNCMEDIDKNWNQILKDQHESNICNPFMLNFVMCGGTPFYCKDTNDGILKSCFCKKMVWIAFVRIVLQTCVSSGKITVCSITPATDFTSTLKKGESNLNFIFY